MMEDGYLLGIPVIEMISVIAMRYVICLMPQ